MMPAAPGYAPGMDPTLQQGSYAPGGSHRHADVADEVVADDLAMTAERDEVEAPGVTLDEDEAAARSELAVHLLPSVFPASVTTIVETARNQGAAPELVHRLGRLPMGTYHTVQEVWTALGGPTETRDTGGARAAGTASPPAPVATERPSVTTAPSYVDRVAVCTGRVAETAVRVLLAVPATVARRLARHWPGRG